VNTNQDSANQDGANQDGASGDSEQPRTTGQKIGGAIKELLIIVVGALIIAALIRAFVGQLFVIPSGSMENTLQINDKIAVQKITKFHRGDVVVFSDPGGWLPPKPDTRGPVGKALEWVGVLPNSSTGHLVKRVIGMPGDHVKCCNSHDRITVNGYPLHGSSYLYRGPGGRQNKPSAFPFNVVVPKDRIWVMGDHRNDSADSRCHLGDTTTSGVPGANAFVPVSDVVGPAFAIVAPFSRATTLSSPKTFSGVPKPHGKPPAEPKILRHHVRC
jgi:signal peptidase I